MCPVFRPKVIVLAFKLASGGGRSVGTSDAGTKPLKLARILVPEGGKKAAPVLEKTYISSRGGPGHIFRSIVSCPLKTVKLKDNTINTPLYTVLSKGQADYLRPQFWD